MYRVTRVIPVLCLAVAVGCGQLLGASDFEVGHARPDSGGACEDFGLPAGSACRTCQFDNCCAESIACRDDATCSAFARCMAQCSHDDGACLAGCYSSPKTYKIKQWLGCTMTHCGSSCVGCAEPGAAFGEACANCQVTVGCTEHKACREDPGCAAWMGCVTERCDPWDLGPACRVACSDENPTYVTGFRAWGFRIAGCADQCGWGLHWDCANPTIPEMPVGDSNLTTDLQMTIGTLLGTTTLPTLGVRACRDLDGVCGPSVNTDSSGVANVTLNRNGTSLPTLYTSTYFELSAPSGERELIYLGRALTTENSFARVQFLDVTNNTDLATSGIVNPGKGVILMTIADCVGAANIFSKSGNPTGMLEGGPAAVYSQGGVPDPTIESAYQAWFYPVDPGLRTVHVITPDGRDVYQARILVQADTTTVLYVNFPVWLQ